MKTILTGVWFAIPVVGNANAQVTCPNPIPDNLSGPQIIACLREMQKGTVDVSDPINFDNQGTAILIPKYYDAKFCALTRVLISNAQGTIGECYVWKTGQGWMMKATPNAGWQHCEVTCWK